MKQTRAQKESLRKYLESMQCPHCKGVGSVCKACNGTGHSARFERLLAAASKGIARPVT